jgi:FixJ family two-component response regulator
MAEATTSAAASVAPETVRIAVVDDDPSVLRSLERLLRVHGFEARAYSSAPALLAEVAALRPNCIIADLYLPELSGLELQQSLAAAGLAFPLVFVTGHGDIRSSVLAMRQGAVDFLAKPFRDDELLEAVERALQRDRTARAAAALDAAFHRRASSLTRRERDVLAAVIEGLRNKQIAAKLGIAEKTVKIHRARIMTKMGVRSVAQLARITERFGFTGGR